jgi:ATP-dependent DNA helicase RecQ
MSKFENPQARLTKAVDEALAQFPGATATIEALLPLVSQKFGRRMIASQLRSFLHKYPTRYRQDDAARWTLIQTVQAVDESEDIPFAQTSRQISANLRSGAYIVFDLETMGEWKGLDQPGDIEILQIAAQKYEHFTPVGEPFMSFVRPTRNIPARITHLTRISQEDVSKSQNIQTVLEAFFAYTADYPLIAHNGVLFDGPVLQYVCSHIGYQLPHPLLVLDTLPLARALLALGSLSPIDSTPLSNYRLGTLARFYGCEEEGAHRADVDISMLGGVIRGLLGELFVLPGTGPSVQPRHPAAIFIRALLQRAADPWLALCKDLAPHMEEINLASLFALFAISASPLLEQTSDLVPAGPTPEALEAILSDYEKHGRERRDSQVRLAHLAGQAMRENACVVIEAGTGTGKGLGYLAPAYLQAKATGRPVVVSTFTRVLQDQLYHSDLQFLREVVQGQVKCALLKGRHNYLSSRCLAEELEDAFADVVLEPYQAWALITLISFALVSTSGDLSDVQSAFAGIAHIVLANGSLFMELGSTSPAALEPGRGAEVWNLLARVRVTAEVPQMPWPQGLPRPHERLDFAPLARENARRADIVVVNHSLLLRKALREPEKEEESLIEAGGEGHGLISPYLVCDEAHTLEDAATSVLTRTVSEQLVRRILTAVIGRRGVQGKAYDGLLRTCRQLGLARDDPIIQELFQLSRELLSQLEVLGQHLRRYIEHHTVTHAEDRLRYGLSIQLVRRSLMTAGGPALKQGGEQLVALLLELRDLLEALAAPIARQAQAVSSISDIRKATRAERTRLAVLEELQELARDAYWYWHFFDEASTVRVVRFEPGEGTTNWSLSGMPIAVGTLLHAHLWSKLASAVITSATLTSWGENFDFFVERTGLARLPESQLRTEALPHVFDYQKHALFLMPNHLPAPRDIALRRAYPEAVAEELKRFIPFFGGKTLVLFTAHARMEQVHELDVGVLEQEGFPLLTQDEGDALERFKNEERVSLLGVRSLWEGVNVPGPSLSAVLIEKFPFPSLGDPLEMARMVAIERAGGDNFYDYLLPRALFLLKQGFGRLIRKSDDHGVVIMLDKRLRSAMYRGEVLAALPRPTLGYESDLAMYQRIANWMGIDFDPDQIPLSAQNEILKLLEVNQLPVSVVTEEEWKTIALPRIERVFNGIWGKRELRPFQVEALHAVLTGRDVLTLAPTGSGKSLTYQLPALLRSGCTLVISPLVALIRDQVTTLREQYGLFMVNSLVSGMSSAEQEEVLNDARIGKVKLLYVAPERLRDPRFRATLLQLPLVQLVVDEAHCISTWGHDFRPDFLEIPQLLNSLVEQRLPVHALTATATPLVQQEITTVLQFGISSDIHHREPLIHHSPNRRENLIYRIYHCSTAREREGYVLEIVRQILADHDRGGPGIVYVATRAKTERLAELLRTNNVTAYAYHGGLQAAERHTIQELFMSGEIEVVCCTNAFGMGVDKQNIRFVIHYDHPASVEAYAQETGRAGRDGKDAFAILLASSATQRTHRSIARKNAQESENIYALLAILQDMHVSSQLSDGGILTSFAELSQLLGVEEGAIRVLLHGAEQVGLLQRGPDVITEAGIFVSDTISTLAARFEESRDRLVLTQLLQHLSAHHNVSLASGGTDWRANYSAKRWLEIGGDVVEAMRLLHRLSELEPERCIFRPYARGIYLRLSPYSSAEKEVACRQLAAFFAGRYARFEQRLQDMLEYIRQAEIGCLPAFIERYLSGRTDIPSCGKCGYCAPQYPLPWNELLVEANITQTQPIQQSLQADQTDIALSILGTLKDHNGYFSQNTLIKMLLGEARGRSSNGISYQLPITARQSEHFGELKHSALKEQHIRDQIRHLSEKGYILLQERLRPGSQGDQAKYVCLSLSSIGRDFLAGEVLVEEMKASF